MGAKVREKGGYYWVVIHHNRQRRWKKVGKDKREAEQLANRINALIAAGAFVLPDRRRTLRTERMLQQWYRDYRPTLSPSFARLAELNITYLDQPGLRFRIRNDDGEKLFAAAPDSSDVGYLLVTPRLEYKTLYRVQYPDDLLREAAGCLDAGR